MIATKNDIEKIIPHRYEMSLVDEIIENTDDYVIGRLILKKDDWFFKGHFPNKPVMPGVLMIEAAAQIGAYKILTEFPDKIGMLIGVNEFIVKNTITIGDILTIKATLLKFRFGIGKANIEGHSQNNKLVFKGELTFALANKV